MTNKFTYYRKQLIKLVYNSNFLEFFKLTMQKPSQVRVNCAKIHKISISSRKKLDEGFSIIYQEGQDHFFKVGSFSRNLKNMIFGEYKYERSVSYFWYEEDGEGFVHVLSILGNANTFEELQKFSSTLAQYANVKDLQNMEPECELIKRVKQAYPEYETKQVMSTWNALTNISKGMGYIAGTFSGIFSKPMENAGSAIQEKTEAMTEGKVSEQTKSKWGAVRENISALNKKMTEGIKPVADVSKNVTSKIGHSFNNSQNVLIKSFRNMSMKTKSAINEGYTQAITQPDSSKPLPAQSDSVLETYVKK